MGIADTPSGSFVLKGVVATGLAVAVIATIMVVGIKMKLPPPDPDWRAHLPPPEPPMTRRWMIIRFGPLIASFVALFILGVGLTFGSEALPRMMAMVVVALAVLRVVGAIAWAMHVRKQQRLRAATATAERQDASNLGVP